MTEDEAVGWTSHRLSGHEFEQTPGDSEGQGSLVCCSPWGCKESDMTERLNYNSCVVPGARVPRAKIWHAILGASHSNSLPSRFSYFPNT